MDDVGKLFALKKVNLRGLEADAIEDYMNEIALLHKLKDNTWIIHLYDSEVNLERGLILMVFDTLIAQSFVHDSTNSLPYAIRSLSMEKLI